MHGSRQELTEPLINAHRIQWGKKIPKNPPKTVQTRQDDVTRTYEALVTGRTAPENSKSDEERHGPQRMTMSVGDIR